MARILSNCLLIMLLVFKTFKESVHKMGKVYCCDSGIRLGLGSDPKNRGGWSGGCFVHVSAIAYHGEKNNEQDWVLFYSNIYLSYGWILAAASFMSEYLSFTM